MEVKVTYNRDPSKVRYPAGTGRSVAIKYELYDPEFSGELAESERLSGGYRIGGVLGIKSADSENRYEGEIHHVLIQNQKHTEEHKIRILDQKLYEEGVHDGWTADNITVEGAYDIKIGHYMTFKMSEENK
jgi:hypothetical protein